MNLTRLIRREIAHRKINFALSVLSVAAAALCLIGAEAILRSDSIATRKILAEKQTQTNQLIAQKQAVVAKAGAELEDATRKQMLGLGFNILILPQGQDLSELHLNGTPSATMPAEYVDRLAKSPIVSINHLLPSVSKRIQWSEQNMEVVLFGTRGEVPIMHQDMKKPLLDAVAPGQMVIGFTVHQKLKLKVGDSVKCLGRDFKISKLHPQRGSMDDVTVWIDLATAQEMLGLQNLVHAILALECECTGDRITQIRQEIAGILPGTQVIERYSQAVTRAESRNHAKLVAQQALAAEEKVAADLLARESASRESLETQHATMATALVPLSILAAMLLVGLLAYNNANHRREEIGILRAIGLRASQIMFIFLGRAMLSGVLGGCVGLAIGLVLACNYNAGADVLVSFNDILASRGFVWLLLATPLVTVALAMIASWIAAIFAVRQDTAAVLQC